MKKQNPAPKRGQRKILPSISELERQLSLNPVTGELTRLVGRGNVRYGDTAGYVNCKGYLAMKVCGMEYLVHRIVWKMFHHEEPPDQLDHENGVRTDNRPGNLRKATGFQNAANAKQKRTNTSGVKGVYPTRHGRWVAYVTSHRKQVTIGRYGSLDEAAAAVRAARERLHGEFARHS